MKRGYCTDDRRVPRLPGDAGMTLLELMIAAGITAMALVLMMGSLGSVAHSGASTEERSIAAAHVSTVLEELSEADLEELLAYEAPALEGLRGETIAVRCVDGSGNEVTLPATQAIGTVPNPVEVRVTVTWQDSAGHTYSRSGSTFYRY
jgi:type II secretory pathway pseudopilin PulG